MSSYEEVLEELKFFLKKPFGDTGEVFLLRGSWGIGKTYISKDAISSIEKPPLTRKQQFLIAKNIFLEKCDWKTKLKILSESELWNTNVTYISLFGINSIHEIKQNICFNNLKNFITDITKFFRGAGDATATSVAFSKIYKKIICIDDIERSNKNLSMVDLLGFVSMLKEERKCKIILIVNDKELGERANDFAAYKEKVVDYSPHLQTTPKEAILRTIDNSELKTQLPHIAEFISERCDKLQITNLRTIKKIIRHAQRQSDLIKHNSLEVQNSAYSTLVLFNWIHDNPKNEVPTIDYIKNERAEFRYTKHLREELTPEQIAIKEMKKAWELILNEYDFESISELDEQILFLVENGYIKEKLFNEALKFEEANFGARKRAEAYHKAWDDGFHGSFKNNANEVLDKLYATTKSDIGNISSGNVSGVVSLLRSYDRNDEAEELIILFIDSKKNNEEYWREVRDGRASFGPEDKVFHDKLLDEANKYFAEKMSKTTLREIVLDMLENGWSSEQEEYLNASTVEDFRTLFKEAQGKELNDFGYKLLFFKKISNPTERQRAITEKVVSALKEIGRENPMNKRRILKFGITLDEEIQ